MTSPEPPERRFTRARRKADARGAADWPSMRERIDLADVARRLLGEPPGRRGQGGARLWWPCPFHPDRNPSFCVEPGKPWWRCFGCGQHGDAISLVMKHRHVGFREASAFILGEPIASGGRPGGRPWSSARRRAEPGAADPHPFAPRPRPADERHRRAESLASLAAGRLWAPEGRPALEYLRGRGLADATIRAARLGFATAASLPGPGGARSPTFRGVTIPWYGPRGLELLKVRQLDGREPRYGELYRRQPRYYPGEPLAPIHRGGGVVVVVEGECDALLLGQELAGLATVITTGPASSRPSAELDLELSGALRLYLATDADPAGDRAAGRYPGKGVRVRPPAPHKDWTDAHRAGVALRSWWESRLMPDRGDVATHREAAAGEVRPGAYGPFPSRGPRPAEVVPLCWLPEPQEKWVPPPMPGRRDDGTLWFEEPA